MGLRCMVIYCLDCKVHFVDTYPSRTITCTLVYNNLDCTYTGEHIGLSTHGISSILLW